MTLQEKLRELNDNDGPNIPQRTLAVYCGVTQPQLNAFMKKGTGISEERRQLMERGLRELAQEILSIVQEDKK